MNITRNRQERCVMARIQRQGKRYQENFGVTAYGGWNDAVAAAKEWVEKMRTKLPPAITSKDKLTSRNSSGIVGVHLHRQVLRKPGGKEYEYFSWVARWPGCRHRGGVKWSVHQYGDDDSFLLAVLCRRMETVVRSKVIEAVAKLGKRERQTLLKKKGLEIQDA